MVDLFLDGGARTGLVVEGKESKRERARGRMKDHTHAPNNNSCRSNIVPTLTRGTSAENFFVFLFLVL